MREPVNVPGTLYLTCTEDGTLLDRFGRPIKGCKRRSETEQVRVRFYDEGGEIRSKDYGYLVARALVDGFEPGMAVKYVDGDRTNFHPSNLEWVEKRNRTRAEFNERNLAMEHKRRRRRKAEMADPNDPRHGTTAGYNNGCRCEGCVGAQRLYRRERRIRDTLRASGVNPYTGGAL